MKVKTLKVENNYNGNDVIVNISKTGDYVQITEHGKDERMEEIITVSLNDFKKIIELFNK